MTTDNLRPYLSRHEWLFQQLCGLAFLPDGRPAWPVAQANGVAEKTFRVRLSRGWSPERASSEVPRNLKQPKSLDEWEACAVENGISLRAFRSRLRAGWPEVIAASRPLR